MKSVAIAGLAIWSAHCIVGHDDPVSSVSQGTERLKKFEAEVDELRQRLKIPGMAVAIVKDEKLIWTKGFGFADVENNLPATPDTLFHLASVTKTIAATLILQLVEQGKLSLDEPVSIYSPTFKDDTVKIRHLITHTSQGVPGDAFRYNGNLYGNLTAVLEKKTGRRFSELVVEKFFEPLAMTKSVPYHHIVVEADQWKASLGQDKIDRYAENLKAFAKPYTYYGAGEIVPAEYPLPKYRGGSAGILSTVRDLARYSIAIDNHAFLKPHTQNQAWTSSKSNSGKRLPYGLGWFVMDHKGTKFVWHTGDWGTGFSAMLFKVPEKKLSLIMFANSEAMVQHQYSIGEVMVDDAIRNAFVCRFLAMYDLDPGQGALAELAVRAFIEQRRRTGKTAINVDSKLLDSYVGRYQFGETFGNRLFSVTREQGRMFLQINSEPKMEIFADSASTFFIKTRSWWLRFKSLDGQPPILEFVDGTTVHSSKRLDK